MSCAELYHIGSQCFTAWIGVGWRDKGDAWLAAQGQREKMQSRTWAREARCIERSGSADP